MLLGDLFQLPPVGGSPPYSINSHSSAACARGLALWRSFSEVYVLDFIYRQLGDEEFRMALQRLARGESTEADWRLFMTRRVQNISAEENALFEKNLHLFRNNEAVSEFNRKKLAMNGEPVPVSQAVTTASPNMVDDDEVTKHEESTLLSIKARVMLTQNLWVEAGLVNGARGTIVFILKPDLESLGVNAMILVKFDHYSGPSLPNLEQGVVPIMASSKSGKLQIPLTLAWATTIHKSQGLTLDKVTVDIGEFEFAAGLSFVALSRVRKIGDLRLAKFDYSRIAPKNGNKTKLMRQRMEEYERLMNLAL